MKSYHCATFWCTGLLEGYMGGRIISIVLIVDLFSCDMWIWIIEELPKELEDNNVCNIIEWKNHLRPWLVHGFKE